MLRFLLHRAADKPHPVGIFHVVHFLRYAEPAAAQFSNCIRRSILLLREQKQRPCEGMEHQHPALDRLGKNVCHPAQAVLCRLWLTKDLHRIARRRQNSLHCSAPPIDSSRGKLQVRLPAPYYIPACTAARCCSVNRSVQGFFSKRQAAPDGSSAGRAS